MGFGSRGRHLLTFFGDMSGLYAEEAEVLLEATLLLLLCELAIFTKLRGEVGVGLFLVSIATARVSVTRVTRVSRVALSATVVFILVSVLSGVVVCIALSFIIRAFVLGGSDFLWPPQNGAPTNGS